VLTLLSCEIAIIIRSFCGTVEGGVSVNDVDNAYPLT